MRGARYDPWKRVIDLVVASLLLVATSPLQAVIAVLVRLNLGSPTLFRQSRPGKDEVVFELVKFRTMTTPDSSRGLVSDEQRLGRFGTVLRATSMDELPTLWNVVRGDMSLVGPRPLLVQYLDLYTPEQRRRHEVRPGVTGLAQVSGRNAVAWGDRFALDVAYVDRRSPLLDCAILLRTVWKVVSREGVTDGTGPTMTAFTGVGADGGEDEY